MGDQYKIRASDRDRQQVVNRLRSALDDGRLTMDEYVDRMGLAYQAATYGDLAPLCMDLPASTPVIARPPATAAATAPPATVFPRVGYLAGLPTVLKVLWTLWLVAVSINVIVWGLVSGASGHLAYPWPVWVAGPYGAALFAVSAGLTLFWRSRPPLPTTGEPVSPQVEASLRAWIGDLVCWQGFSQCAGCCSCRGPGRRGDGRDPVHGRLVRHDVGCPPASLRRVAGHGLPC